MTLVTDTHKSANLRVRWYDVLLCLPILPNACYVSVIHTLSSILNQLLQGRTHWSLEEPKEDNRSI